MLPISNLLFNKELSDNLIIKGFQDWGRWWRHRRTLDSPCPMNTTRLLSNNPKYTRNWPEDYLKTTTTQGREEVTMKKKVTGTLTILMKDEIKPNLTYTKTKRWKETILPDGLYHWAKGSLVKVWLAMRLYSVDFLSRGKGEGGEEDWLFRCLKDDGSWNYILLCN